MGQGKPGSDRSGNASAGPGGHDGPLAEPAPDATSDPARDSPPDVAPGIQETGVPAGEQAQRREEAGKSPVATGAAPPIGSHAGAAPALPIPASVSHRALTGDTTTTGAGTLTGGSAGAGGKGEDQALRAERKGHDPALRAWAHLELLAKVGEGGFGETFRARDTRLAREVALKLLKVDASKEEALAGLVIREGALLARVRHPNVVTVYGAEQYGGEVGLWMEYIHGCTLEALLGERLFGEREAVLIGVDLCGALAAVHGAGIIHRDIKAANVMRESGGRIVLMDFGLGLDMKGVEAGAAGSLAGTPFYMAPELLRGEPATVRSDLYGAGVLLYRLVTGRYPLTGRTLAELREGIEAGRAVRLRDVRADLSIGFVRVVERCLEREPARRFETAGALEAALMDTLGALGAPAFAAAGAGVAAAADGGRAHPGKSAAELARSADFTAYRKGRIAEWSQPRYRLDKEFVALTLLVDQGEESAAGRWGARPEQYRDLGELLAAVADRVIVLLGPPGSGKSTLLRRFELDVSEAALAVAADGRSRPPDSGGPQDKAGPQNSGGLPDGGDLQDSGEQDRGDWSDRGDLPDRGAPQHSGGLPDGGTLPDRGEPPRGALAPQDRGPEDSRAPLQAGQPKDRATPPETGERPGRGGSSGSLHPVTFFIQLNHYQPARPGDPPPDPGAWLAERWGARFPDLPPLPELLEAGRMVLLLDGLNEMASAGSAGPAGSGGPGSARAAVVLWKEFLDRLVAEHPGNRVIFSCRALDYSAPLSTPSLRVPQVVIEPMTDAQVEQCLVKQDPVLGAEIWLQLRGTPQLEVMRSPYFLSLLVEQAAAAGEIPRGRAGLFTGFVRRALRREIERDNPLFAPDGLLTERDARRIAQGKWGTPWELPERGALIPKLSDLAFGMQVRSEGGGASQVRIDYDDALDLIDHELDEKIVKAGEALSVLDEDSAHGEVKYFHQLVQEYFAGRRLGEKPEPERVRTPWRSAEIVPPLVEVLGRLPPAETLPPLATTGWEETALLASAMSAHPDGFVRGLMETSLALAGRCASQPEVRPQLSPGLLDELRAALVGRSRDGGADLRSRIETGLALGPLGDPRFERCRGPHGDYLRPPLAGIAGGCYPLGEDAPFESLGDRWTDHMPRHEIELAPFRIARFPVTNAEWALFMAAGGYEDERWWDTAAALRWQRGEGTADGIRAQVRYWLERFRKDPGDLETRWTSRSLTEEVYERWKRRLALTEGELDAHLKDLYPGGLLREPQFWRDGTWNNPAQPVVGVCWFEARAYARWLAAQTGEAFRLPTEAEWEAAARGRAGRLYAYGSEFDPLRGNTAETRIWRTTPVGVLVEGETPEGVSDLTGNVEEWTASLFGVGGPNEPAAFRYPYRPEDGREDPSAGADVRRVLRGGAWSTPRDLAHAANRVDSLPDYRFNHLGLRLAAAPGPD